MISFERDITLLKYFIISAETDHFLPIHREAPAFIEQATDQQILVTGIKVCLTFVFVVPSYLIFNFKIQFF